MFIYLQHILAFYWLNLGHISLWSYNISETRSKASRWEETQKAGDDSQLMKWQISLTEESLSGEKVREAGKI